MKCARQWLDMGGDRCDAAAVKCYQLSASAIGEQLDSEAIVLHLPTSTYYRLNPVAAWVYQALVRPRHTDDLAQEVAAHFDAQLEIVRSDIEELLVALERAGLVERCEL